MVEAFARGEEGREIGVLIPSQAPVRLALAGLRSGHEQEAYYRLLKSDNAIILRNRLLEGSTPNDVSSMRTAFDTNRLSFYNDSEALEIVESLSGNFSPDQKRALEELLGLNLEILEIIDNIARLIMNVTEIALDHEITSRQNLLTVWDKIQAKIPLLTQDVENVLEGILGYVLHTEYGFPRTISSEEVSLVEAAIRNLKVTTAYRLICSMLKDREFIPLVQKIRAKGLQAFFWEEALRLGSAKRTSS